jgi:AcrR family transcriptional regulator
MTDAPALDPKRARLSGAERRERFLDAAALIVVETGPSAVTMDGVAQRTGVNKRLGYRHFENREDLLRALLERELDESGRRARALLPDHPDIELRVAVNVRVWLEMMQERGPLLMRLLFDQDVAAGIVRDVNRRVIKDWTQIYVEALGVPEARAEILAHIMIAGLRGAVEALQREAAPLDEIAAIYTQLALAGARSVAESS